MKAVLAVVIALAAVASAPAAAPEQVTIFARPSIAAAEQPVTLFGAVATPRAAEVLEIQARDCGQRLFRHAVSAHIAPNGQWSIYYFPGITTTLRAVRNGKASGQVTVRQRASVRLTPLPSSTTRFQVAVVARTPFWRKRVVVQRFRSGRWTTLRTVVLTKTSAKPGTPVVWSTAKFAASVPKGTLLRALLPLSEARPCYAAGTSKPLRT